MARFYEKNNVPFDIVCRGHFGRKIITTNAPFINESNVVDELNKALAIHSVNSEEIRYLDRYYKGDQPILYRQKKVRPEVNNRVVENLAFMVVETKTSEMAGEPIQYVLHGTDEAKSEEVNELNKIMNGEDKSYFDVELCRWRSICGTAYRYIAVKKDDLLLDESTLRISVENPCNTFVCYYNNGNQAFSCQIRETEDNKTLYFIHTKGETFSIINGEIVAKGKNGNGMIPVIEYPNNARRLSDIEITISITDQLNSMASDRANGIEQFVASWVKFVNCEIDEETYGKMRQEGALVVQSNDKENKADVDILSSELDQSQSQVAVDELYDRFLTIQGMASRQSASGGDTAGAVMLRDGFYINEKRAEISEPIFKRSERMALRVILNHLRIEKKFTLLPSDIEIKISRSKMDNILTKSQALQMLLACGVNPARAIKTVGLFSDPEQVAVESKARMDILYPTDVQKEEQTVEEIVSV